MTPHIESKKEDIAEIVLMPGDPLRAKYIAETYFEDAKLINKIRNMYGYTGFYKGKRLTVFASGMGIPSIGIYAYELFKFYDVKKIIRIGSCGTFNKNINIGDVILAQEAYSLSDFDDFMLEKNVKSMKSSATLNEIILNTAATNNVTVKTGKIITSDVFDLYVDFANFIALHEKENYLGTEMEAFGLFTLANKLKKETACLLTVVDSHNTNKSIPAEEREKALDEMIKLALDSIIK